MKKKVTLVQYGCEKCGHEWIPRRDRAPKVCPQCKRMDWNEKKAKA